MIVHQAKSMNINKHFSFILFISTFDVDSVEKESVVNYVILIIEFKKIMDETETIFVVQKNLSFIHSSAQNMI